MDEKGTDNDNGYLKDIFHFEYDDDYIVNNNHI